MSSISVIVTLPKNWYMSEDTYNGHEALIIKNIYQPTDDNPVYDCVYMIMSDDEVLCMMFIDTAESVETSILSSIK